MDSLGLEIDQQSMQSICRGVVDPTHVHIHTVQRLRP